MAPLIGKKIVFTPPAGSLYTGMLSGILYVDGLKVTEQQFREHVIMCGVKRVEEVRKMGNMKNE